MPLGRFRENRHERWRRLDQLLDRVAREEFSGLSAADAEEFYTLYRLAASDLNLVQTRAGHPALHDYLEALVARAHAALAAPRPGRLWPAWKHMIRHAFPAAVRRQRAAVGAAAALLLAGALFGGVLTLTVPDAAMAFLGGSFPDHLRPPSERVDRDTGDAAPALPASAQLTFAVYLFCNNARVSALAFALGFTFGIGTAILLFYNGAILGCVAARYFADGFGVFFLAWAGPHGSVELPCVALAGAAGLILGRALWRGRGRLAERLLPERSDLVAMLAGVTAWLMLAGAVEAGFSQLHPPLMPYAVKLGIAAVLFAGFLYYLYGMPVDPGAADPAPSA